MKQNVGGMDRIARLILGPILVLAGIAGYAGLLALAVGPLPQALTSVLVLLIGAILLVTGLVGKCPLNRLLGFDTYRQQDTFHVPQTVGPNGVVESHPSGRRTAATIGGYSPRFARTG